MVIINRSKIQFESKSQQENRREFFYWDDFLQPGGTICMLK